MGRLPNSMCSAINENGYNVEFTISPDNVVERIEITDRFGENVAEINRETLEDGRDIFEVELNNGDIEYFTPEGFSCDANGFNIDMSEELSDRIGFSSEATEAMLDGEVDIDKFNEAISDVDQEFKEPTAEEWEKHYELKDEMDEWERDNPDEMDNGDKDYDPKTELDNGTDFQELYDNGDIG